MSKALANIQAQLKKELAELSKRVQPPSGNNISLKGGVFNLPDGSTNKGPMECIILDWRLVNAYYTGPYDPQNPKPPKCWAIAAEIEGMAPVAEEVAEAQHDNCGECPMNEFGSANTGKGKACKNQRRLAVVPVNADKDTQPMTLTVSPSGLAKYENYVNKLSAEMELMPLQVVTKIGFDPNVTYPSLIFGFGSVLPEEQLAEIMNLRQVAQPMLERGFEKA